MAMLRPRDTGIDARLTSNVMRPLLQSLTGGRTTHFPR
jgi:hypothetical protein